MKRFSAVCKRLETGTNCTESVVSISFSATGMGEAGAEPPMRAAASSFGVDEAGGDGMREGKAVQEVSAGGMATTRLRGGGGEDAAAVLLAATGASLVSSSILEREEEATRAHSSAGPPPRAPARPRPCLRGSCAARPRPRVSCSARVRVCKPDVACCFGLIFRAVNFRLSFLFGVTIAILGFCSSSAL